MDNDLEAPSLIPGSSLSAAMSTPPTSPLVGDSNSQLSAERNRARAEAHSRTTDERGATPRDTTRRNRWHARYSCLTGQIYKKRLENLVLRKDDAYHRLTHEMSQELAEMRAQLVEMHASLAIAVDDAARQQHRMGRLMETGLDLRYQLRCARERQAQEDDLLSIPEANGFDVAGSFSDGALVQTRSFEDPYVPVSAESTLPECIYLL